MAGQAASGSSLYRVPQYIVRICRMIRIIRIRITVCIGCHELRVHIVRICRMIRIICIRMASGGSLYMAPQNAGTCMYECKCVCMYVCMHACMYACMHVYVCK